MQSWHRASPVGGGRHADQVRQPSKSVTNCPGGLQSLQVRSEIAREQVITLDVLTEMRQETRQNKLSIQKKLNNCANGNEKKRRPWKQFSASLWLQYR